MKKYNTILKAATIILMAFTPLMVIADANRLGYIPLNGAWFAWTIPALLAYDLEHEVDA